MLNRCDLRHLQCVRVLLCCVLIGYIIIVMRARKVDGDAMFVMDGILCSFPLLMHVELYSHMVTASTITMFLNATHPMLNEGFAFFTPVARTQQMTLC